jgi:two-component system chemotaxis response regulator CheB
MSTGPLQVTRVLVVDDSVLVRRTVTRAFEHDPAIEVIGAVRNGRAAVAKAESLRPDVVILDSVASGDGFPTLAELRRLQPELRAVIFGNLSGGARPRFTGPGATSFARKARPDGIGLSEEDVRTELMPAIRRLGVAGNGERRRPAARNGAATEAPPRRAKARRKHAPLTRAAPAEAIVVAVSTGGPDALDAVVSRFPADLPVPVLVVQHMPAEFTAILAKRLDRASELSVVEGSAGMKVTAGRVYIAPGGRHMEVVRKGDEIALHLHDGPRENGCRPAADVLFRSAANAYGPRLVAVVLTGMGTDGLRGAEIVREAGGWVIAQSESTSVIASMPGAIASAGLANAVVPLEQVGEVLTDHVRGVWR